MKPLNLLFRLFLHTMDTRYHRSLNLITLTLICFVCGGLGALQVRAMQQKQQQKHLEQTQQAIQQNGTLREVAMLRQQLKIEQQARLRMAKQMENMKVEVTQNYVPKKSALAAAAHLKREVQRLKSVAGLTQVQGAGIVITLSDNRQTAELVHDFDLQQTVHELLSVKATAIALQGEGGEPIRLTAYTPIRCVGPAILVNFQPVVAPYKIMALGPPTSLKNALEMPEGIRDRARKAGLGIQIESASNLKLPSAKKTL